jgi:predicted PurR-regulated permease PerM
VSVGERVTPPSWLVAARLVSFAVICAALYWGQVVLIPLALAVLLAFVLSPAVVRCQRIGLPRIPAVLFVVACAAAALGGIGWVVGGELSALAAELPTYRSNIRAKIADVRKLTRGGTLEQVQSTIEGIGEDIERGAAEAARNDDVLQVEIAPDRSLVGDLERFLPLLETATTVGLALLLSILMLIEREDVRNRIVSIAGQASLVTTTKAFAETGQRISRYLLMQLIVNSSMGLAVWLGLYLIGVPYSALWGLVAAVLRYVPYIGPWIAALFPITLSLVTSPAWADVALVVALFLALELVINNVVEPWLYGQSVGLSPIAVIVAVIFWTWIWGAVGLVLATPLTVCLVVIGKHISGLAIFDQLLGEGRALEPYLWLYQRLLARDEAEAGDVIEEFAAEHTLEQTCEDLLLPALLVLKHDVASGHIDTTEAAFVAENLIEIVAELPQEDAPAATGQPHVLFAGLPPQDKLDEIVLLILQVLLRREPRSELMILSAEQLVGERVAAVEARPPDAVCIPSLPPGDLAATRGACKRLRAALPRVPIIVGRIGNRRLSERGRQSLIDAGASTVVETLEEFRDALLAIVTTVAPLPRSEEVEVPRALAIRSAS